MKKLIIFMLCCCGLIQPLLAQQRGVLDEIGSRASNFGSGNNNARKDSIGFEHRDDRKDSISITYKFLDSVKNNTLDSSINDFDRYFSLPSAYQYLGNNGAAAYSMIFKPFVKPGFDAGFHAFDIYKYTLEGTKFYKTNRPFTQLGYQLASGKEQMIKVFHTQNPRPNWNFGMDYRLISAPGFFVTQNTNHKNFRIFSTYQGKRKRYAAYFVLMGNTIKNSENGGIESDSLLYDKNKKKRFSIPVNLGGANLFQPNPFNASVITGNVYKDFSFFLRQTYDLGKRDTININDTTREFLFYPKLRLQYSFNLNTYQYNFRDYAADSVIYKSWYDTSLRRSTDSFYVREKWTVISNDFSLLQFPETKNPAQFFLAGARLENIKGELKGGTTHLYNMVLHAEYRNKTRNKLWDVLAKGEYYLNGFNHGDYSMSASIGRYFDKRFGAVSIFFTNVNRSPSYIYNNGSSFNFNSYSLTKKENIISFGATANNAFVNLAFKNHLITNYSYFTDYFHTAQSSKVINLLQVFASKKIKLTKKWNWYVDLVAQQTDGASPVKVPLLFTRNRLAFEGQYFKNLNVSTGIEVRYYTPYKGYNYSPVMGQFMPQDTVTLSNRPDISAFFHFRIKSFTAFVRAENLNTMSFTNGFGFTNNNFAAPHYPTPGLMIRFGIQWGFIN
ncbi:MAG: putative porin [Chitinophagaceae bacterium]